MKIKAKYTVETAKLGKTVGVFRCTLTDNGKRVTDTGDFTVRFIGSCLNMLRNNAAEEAL